MFLPAFALLLLVVSGFLLDQHRRAWLVEGANDSADPRDRRSARAQYLRRMRASGSIGVIGLLLILYPVVPRTPLAFTLYVLLLVMICGYILLLAFVDSFATSLRIRRARRESASLESKLEAELKEFRSRNRE